MGKLFNLSYTSICLSGKPVKLVEWSKVGHNVCPPPKRKKKNSVCLRGKKTPVNQRVWVQKLKYSITNRLWYCLAPVVVTLLQVFQFSSADWAPNGTLSPMLHCTTYVHPKGIRDAHQSQDLERRKGSRDICTKLPRSCCTTAFQKENVSSFQQRYFKVRLLFFHLKVNIFHEGVKKHYFLPTSPSYNTSILGI